MSATHPVLASLYKGEKDVFTAITTDYEIIADLTADQMSPEAIMRRELMVQFVRMADVCYDDYLCKRSHTRMADQDLWIPAFKAILDLVEQFSDRSTLKEIFNEWLKNYTLYRNWVPSCGLSRSELAELWFAIDEEDSDSEYHP